MNSLPQARSSDVVVQVLGKELLVYDLKTDQIYTLNETAMIVFESCNGATTFDELKRGHKFSDDLIYLTLDELRKNDLLQNYKSIHFAGMSRREVIKKVGLASMLALPWIAAVSAPRAAAAASGGQALYSVCTTEAASGSAECRSGKCSHTQVVAPGGDGVSNTSADSGVKRCCAATNSGAGYESNNSYYRAFDCSFASLCCSGTGSSPEFPNAKGSYTCTCT